MFLLCLVRRVFLTNGMGNVILKYIMNERNGKNMYSRVYVEITDICNRNCSFCPGTKRPLRRMSEEEFRTVAEKLRSVTKYLYFHVMGEPLTHPLLPDFIRIANANGYRAAITTNGTLLSRRGREIVEAGIYKVNISVHSFEGEDTEAYLDYLENCFEFADKANRAGVLVVMRLWNRGFDGGRNLDIVSRLRQRFPDGEWKESPTGARIRHKLHLEYGERFAWPDMNAEDGGDRVFCYGLSDHFAVLCDGTVVPCCLDRNGDLALGNIFEDDLDTILNSDRARNIAEGFKCRTAHEELCRKCGYARRFKIT